MKKIVYLSLATGVFFFSFTQADIRKWFIEQTALLPKQLKSTMSNDSQPKEIIYQWVDAKGVRHFSNTKPLRMEGVKAVPAADYTVPTISLPKKSLLPVNKRPTKKLAKPSRKPVKKKKKPALINEKVMIFTATRCDYCKQALAFLRSHGIAFKEYNIDQDKSAKKKMRAAGGVQHVPFALINGKKMFGFSKSRYRRALNLPQTTARISTTSSRSTIRSTRKT